MSNGLAPASAIRPATFTPRQAPVLGLVAFSPSSLKLQTKRRRYQFLLGAKLVSSSGWGKSSIVKNRSGAVKVVVNVLRKISYMGLIGIVIKESTANSKAAISVKYSRSILQMLRIYRAKLINLNRS